MAMIRVTSSRLRNAAENLQNLNSQFKNKEEDLRAKEQALSQMWEGQAQAAFHGAFTRDSQQMDAFHQLINQYVHALLEIAERYERAEARNAEIAGARSY
ncbi:MAG: WXG100 family type VII secretion target [Suilimivivens sp.]